MHDRLTEAPQNGVFAGIAQIQEYLDARYDCESHTPHRLPDTLAHGSLSSVRDHSTSSTMQIRASNLRSFRETRNPMMRRISALSFLLCLCNIQAPAQVTPGRLTFALPEHPGRMTLE